MFKKIKFDKREFFLELFILCPVWIAWVFSFEIPLKVIILRFFKTFYNYPSLRYVRHYETSYIIFFLIFSVFVFRMIFNINRQIGFFKKNSRKSFWFESVFMIMYLFIMYKYETIFDYYPNDFQSFINLFFYALYGFLARWILDLKYKKTSEDESKKIKVNKAIKNIYKFFLVVLTFMISFFFILLIRDKYLKQISEKGKIYFVDDIKSISKEINKIPVETDISLINRFVEKNHLNIWILYLSLIKVINWQLKESFFIKIIIWKMKKASLLLTLLSISFF